MAKSQKNILHDLKNLNLSRAYISLAIVKEYKKERVSHYDIKYVQIDELIEKRLRGIINNHINNSNTVEEYTYDCPEPEAEQLRAIDYSQTDFYKILEQLRELNPEEDIINGLDELVMAKAYLIVLRNREGIQVVGFKTLPENWKMKRSKGLIPLLYKENRFEDLEEENVFSIAGLVDLIYFNDLLFILSKKEFERGLNFREGMIENANLMFEEISQLNLFGNINILANRVGNNQRYLRKISTIKNLGYYKDPKFLERVQQVCHEKGWDIRFDQGQITFTEETIDDILTILQNKRLHSEITNQDFDVESAKPLG